MNKLVTKQIDNKLLNLILKGCNLINISLLDDKIQPKTGIPQGSVKWPNFILNIYQRIIQHNQRQTPECHNTSISRRHNHISKTKQEL